MESNATFIIGICLEDPAADPLTFTFQQDLSGKRTCAVRVPRGLRDALASDAFADYLTDRYLQQHPTETERLGRERLRGAVERAIRR
ncbi:hypothetical protein Q5H92_21810 [Hymenobacter sp. M29]|uniref:DUF1488 family protein n=1 Tax=Hymenobacter mellowenesis TaxID=3063995 RepID=A0ABT9AGQ4_9BACT|nr:hypothetical protein [Hymenobacter sp. M29]MDO7849016.1 hypothetical protein [Hymenobacter sp. M29]